MIIKNKDNINNKIKNLFTKKNNLKTIHLVYPFDLTKNYSPWEEGNQIYKSLKDIYNFKIYNWMSFQKIHPKKEIYF